MAAISSLLLVLAVAGLLALGFGVRLFERNEFGLGGLGCHHFFLGNGRRAGGDRLRSRARGNRRELQDRVAFRADDRVLAEVVEFGAAIGAETLGAELGFGHGPGSLSGV